MADKIDGGNVVSYQTSAHLYDAHLDLDYSAGAQRAVAAAKAKGMEPSTILDLGCGTGCLLEHLQNDYVCHGLDLSPAMLEVAANRTQNVAFHEASMVDFSIDARFDLVVSTFGSIAFVRTLENLQTALECTVRHMNPGGVLLAEPWYEPHQLWEGTLQHDLTEGEDYTVSSLYLVEREGDCAVYRVHYLIGTSEGVEHVEDIEILGLWTREQYLETFRAAGLQVEWSDEGLLPAHPRGMYVAVLPR